MPETRPILPHIAQGTIDLKVIFYTLGEMLGVFLTPDCLIYLALLYGLGLAALPLCHRFLDRTKIFWAVSAKILGANPAGCASFFPLPVGLTSSMVTRRVPAPW